MYFRQIEARRQREMFENEMGEVSKYHRKMVSQPNFSTQMC